MTKVAEFAKAHHTDYFEAWSAGGPEEKQAYYWPYLVLNERAGQLYKAVHCKVMRQWKTEVQMGLKNR